MSDGLRRCSICKQDKPIDDFRKLKYGRSSHCKPCAAAYLRDWRAKNKERLREQRRARTEAERETHRERRSQYDKAAYAKDPDKFRDGRLRYQFGITLEDYRAMESAQNRVCAICGGECPTGRALAVDHNHETGEVRGLLCANCNRAIGLLKDDPDRLLAAAAYLLSFEDVLRGAIP